MDSIEEKRVYGDREGAVEAYVASAIGVVRVRVAGDTVGEFGLCHRCVARDIAATDGIVAVATDDDVQVLSLEDELDGATDGDGTFVDTGFGPAVAVGSHDGALIAAGPDGDVARLAAPSLDSVGADTTIADAEWDPLESDGVDAVRAIDGDLVGTDGGVYRVHDGRLDHAGLADVRDVSAAGVPLAATADGLYKLGNGWMEVLEGSFETVAADPHSDSGQLLRAHAVGGETVYEYGDDDEWRAYDRSSETIVGLGYGETVYAVTDGGTFLSATPDDEAPWRTQTLGVGDVTGLVVPAVR